MKKSVLFTIIGIVLVLCLIVAPASASTITTLAELKSACTAGGSHVLGNNISVGANSVSVYKSLELDLKGFTIQGTTSASKVHNALGISSGGSGTTLKNGVISGGSNAGLSIYGNSTLENIEIKNGTSGTYTAEAMYIADGVTVTMTNCNIHNYYRNGINIRANSTLIMNNCNVYSITGTTVSNYRGVFKMYGGKIYNNSGVGLATNQSTTYIYDGEISGNTSGGISSSGNIYISGSSIIKNNTHNGNPENVYLTETTTSVGKIILSGNLSNNAEIHLTSPNTEGGLVGETSGYNFNNKIISDSGLNIISDGTYLWIKSAGLKFNFSISPTSSSYSPANKPVTLTASMVAGSATSYTWSYTTASSPSTSSNWITIRTTSGNSTTFTPTANGKYTFRVIGYRGSISEDSLSKYKPYVNVFNLNSFNLTPPSSSSIQINNPITLTASASGGGTYSYAWSYTTSETPSASSSWTNIGTTSSGSTTFTPITAGKYTFRVILTVGGGSINSFTDKNWSPYITVKLPLSLDDFVTTPSSSSYSPTNVGITLTASTSGGTPTSYVWSYTTTPNPTASSSWTNIGTTSSNSTTYTPTATGTYTFRVIASMTGASVDSLDESLKPYLNIFVALNGGGTSSSPYQVGSNSDLQNWNTYATYYNDKYMVITQDFVPATTVSAFAGNLAGGNHTLTNARLPLFNTLGGTVNNLKFTNSIVSGNGILANTSSAAISNVTADDCFVGGSTTGGLVGNATGSFTDCTVNHITVKGSSTAGGIAGGGNTTVTRCKVLNTDLLAPTTYGVCA